MCGSTGPREPRPGSATKKSSNGPFGRGPGARAGSRRGGPGQRALGDPGGEGGSQARVDGVAALGEDLGAASAVSLCPAAIAPLIGRRVGGAWSPSGRAAQAARRLPRRGACAFPDARGRACRRSGRLARSVAVLAGAPGNDLAAHVYQRTVFLHDGFQLWNNFWYGGRYAFVTYSVLYYPLAALFGIKALAIISIATRRSRSRSSSAGSGDRSPAGRAGRSPSSGRGSSSRPLSRSPSGSHSPCSRSGRSRRESAGSSACSQS